MLPGTERTELRLLSGILRRDGVPQNHQQGRKNPLRGGPVEAIEVLFNSWAVAGGANTIRRIGGPAQLPAAASVASMTESSCAADTNQASNCDGGSRTPTARIRWKKCPKAKVSQSFAS